MRKERDENQTPQVIEQLNKSLSENVPEDIERPTVEGIAQKLGISRNILFEWVNNDNEFSGALERVKTLQENDPFKTGTIEDSWIISLVVTFILMETRDRHYPPNKV